MVVEFAPRDLSGLTETQRGKLVKLVGARFDPVRGVVKISCEMFELQAQNKRYLSDLVDRLVLEAKVCSTFFVLTFGRGLMRRRGGV